MYYDPRHPAGFGGLETLFRAVKEDGKHRISRKQLKKWLSEQDTYTLHKPVRVNFRRNRTVVGGLDEQFQIDLVDLSSISKHNDGYHFLVTCIDVFSRYAWVIPIKRKTGENLVKAFQEILSFGRTPEKVQSDAGTEFLNRKFQAFLKENDITFFTTRSEMKAALVERFNRTLKTRMWKYFTRNNTLRYIEVLQDLVYSYNHSFHRIIKTKPALVTKENEREIWQRQYLSDRSETKKPIKYEFNVGDQVRISGARRVFQKGYLPGWTEEIFKISSRIPRRPPVYRLKDLNDERIEGIFYGKELQKVIKSMDSEFRIEKIVRQRRRGKETEYLVKWMGWPEKFNSWVTSTQMKKL